MTTPAKQYRVKFVNHVYEDEPDGEPIALALTIAALRAGEGV